LAFKAVTMLVCCTDCRNHILCYTGGVNQYLHSFPTRRSSDLDPRTEPRSEGAALLRLCHRPGRILDRTPAPFEPGVLRPGRAGLDRKSTRLNSSHVKISYAVFCLKKKNVLQSSFV